MEVHTPLWLTPCQSPCAGRPEQQRVCKGSGFILVSSYTTPKISGHSVHAWRCKVADAVSMSMRRRPEQQPLRDRGVRLHAGVQLHHVCHHCGVSSCSVCQWRSGLPSCRSHHLQRASGMTTTPGAPAVDLSNHDFFNSASSACKGLDLCSSFRVGQTSRKAYTVLFLDNLFWVRAGNA